MDAFPAAAISGNGPLRGDQTKTKTKCISASSFLPFLLIWCSTYRGNDQVQEYPGGSGAGLNVDGDGWVQFNEAVTFVGNVVNESKDARSGGRGAGGEHVILGFTKGKSMHKRSFFEGWMDRACFGAYRPLRLCLIWPRVMFAAVDACHLATGVGAGMFTNGAPRPV